METNRPTSIITRTPIKNGQPGACYGITANNETEEKLKQSEDRYRTLIERISDAFIALDKNWRYTYLNKQAGEMIHRDPESLIGKNVWDEFPEAIGSPTYEAFNKAMTEQRYISNIDYYPILDIWQENHIYPSPDGLSVFIRDITEKKKAELQINKSEEKYRTLVEQAFDGIIIYSQNGAILDFNYSAYTYLGYSNEEFKKLTINELFFAEDLLTRPLYFKKLKAGQSAIDCRRLKRKDGSYIEMEIGTKMLPDGNLMAIGRDITERKKAEEKLEKKNRELLHSESRLKQAQTIAQIGNWEVNFATNISKWSDEAYRIYGLSPAEHQLSMEAWMSFIHPEDLDEVKKDIERSQASLNDSSFYYRIVRKDGMVRYVLSESKFEFDEEGKPIGLYGIVHDITDLKNNEQELKELNEQMIKRAQELATSNAELERFAYVASHDLQEPLRMVSSFLQLLQKKYEAQLDDTANQYIEFAVDGAGRMKKLILDLLEYSRVGTNKDVVTDINTSEVISQVLETFGSKIAEPGAIIKIQLMPVIKANKTQITQLFQNLVSNALKYNASSVPEIEIGCEEKSNAWQFYVKDNGIGIEQKFLDKVFIIFQRLHNKNQFSGTGIGLAICKKIVERHGGTIWIESQPGTGSVFFFTIKK